jgi:hypothetical protein
VFQKRIISKVCGLATIVSLSFLILLFLSACSGNDGQGSGNFFDDPPDCYYDYLFGCGTFDIPGDSSYYGYNRAARVAKISSGRAGDSLTDFSGEWSGYLSKKSSSCNFATPPKVQGKFSVKQLNRRVTVRVPIAALKSYPLRGPVSKQGFEASTFGAYSICSFRISSKFNSNNGKRASLGINAKINCPLQKSCDFSYEGKVVK